jgi:hypothetical protein
MLSWHTTPPCAVCLRVSTTAPAGCATDANATAAMDAPSKIRIFSPCSADLDDPLDEMNRSIE